MREYYPEWIYHYGDGKLCDRHAAEAAYHGSVRRAAKRHAMPPWADRVAISAVYKKAREATNETGIRHEVDHVVPLQHPLVTGLHTADNLRVITRVENAKKSNKFRVG